LYDKAGSKVDRNLIDYGLPTDCFRRLDSCKHETRYKYNTDEEIKKKLESASGNILA